MDIIQEKYIVYVKTDNKNRIIDINSSAFLDNIDGWIKIDEGLGDKYHHAQAHYFDKSLWTNDFVMRYKLQDGKVIERTSEEIEADKPEPLPPQPTVEELTEKLKQTEDQLTQTQLALTELYEMIIING